MKTKSKLVLGLSILAGATMAAGATSTFAWYQVSAGAANLNGVSATNIAAQADTYSLGDALTITASFDNVGAGTDFVAAVNQTPASFADVELTDEWGRTYAKVEGQDRLVDVTTQAQARKWYGTAIAQVSIQIGGSAATIGGSANDVYAVYAGTYTVTVSGAGHTRVRNAVPTVNATSSGTETAEAITTAFTISISNDGIITTTGADTSNGLSKQFWYCVSPEYSDSNDGAAENPQQVADNASTHHSGDTIAITVTGPQS